MRWTFSSMMAGVAISSRALRGSCDADRFVMGLLRALADALMIGAGTLRADRGHRWTAGSIDREVAANNPICGDQIDLSLRLRDGTVDAIGFTGRGCSISQASASMLCETVSGRTEADAQRLAEQFRAMLQGEDDGADLGDLEALRGVRAYPVRVKCATLPWNALLQGLQGAASENGGAAHD